MVDVLELGEVQLPEWHPRVGDVTALVRAFVIRHPDGVVVFDTGIGSDHPVIDDLYAKPRITPIITALNTVGVDERDVTAIVNSHLHFDHCGQNSALPSVPVYVQAAELIAAQLPHYTIAEWAHIEPDRRRILNGDEEIAPGIQILATPGHTPGHQSLLVHSPDGRAQLIVGQCCYTCAEFEAEAVAADNIHDETYRDAAAETIARLRRLPITDALFSHDRTIYRPPG
ncbi:MAG: MBL fold metallo-hydrolase [Ilumatobacteraceae bacterium]